MAVSSIQSGRNIILQSQDMAKRSTEELNANARSEQARLEETRSEQKRIESAQMEESRLESQLERARQETARLEELQSQQEQNADFGSADKNQVNNLPSAQEQRDLNAQKEQHEQQKTASATEAAVKLEQAKSYNRVGTSVVQRSNDMIGTMLDISI
ncbi:hypothetical protein QWZ04_00095 [Vibrio tapetis subsp. quintayensis]|uniref:hypothetical protein n=1 Tax=Vibrio tapetis TaxID=52443 RepID=UPI0025B33A23|nr:hypothetical protein [Vibrio tapetis]MDN3678747.1 hypothetical protein [Vibrio tapetis subsp. quintayensis]